MSSGTDIDRISLTLPRFTILAVIYRRITDWSDAPPIRPHWRIFWHQEPGASIEMKATTYPLLPDRLLLVPPYLCVQHHLHRPTRGLAFHVQVDSFAGTPPDEPFYPGLPEETIDRFRQIPDTYPDGVGFYDRNNGKDARIVWVLRELVCRSFQYLPPDIWDPTRKDHRIEEAMRTLQQRRKEGCSNDELARQACLATNSFVRLFRQEVGIAPHTYLQHLRLDHATYLLQNSDISIDQIAADCGFCDRNYLSKLFKRRFHVGPAKYRRHADAHVV